MAGFNSDYWNPLDREAMKAYQLTPKQVGISHGAGDVLQGLKANIFAGANQVELGFVGAGKGQRAQPTGVTPEVYGKDEREAMRQMAKVNKVNVTTHASVQAGSLSGLGEKGFSPQQRDKALTEVKRAIDFAADVAGGGPVTFHTAEFPRSIQEKFGKEGFKEYEEEEEKKIHYLVDEKTGQISSAVRQDEVIFRPVQKMENGKPVFTKDPTGKEIPVYEIDEKGDIKVDKVEFGDYAKESGLKGGEAARAFYEEMQTAEKQHAEGQAHEYELMYKRSLETKNALEEIKKEYDKNKDEAKDLRRFQYHTLVNSGVGDEMAKRAVETGRTEEVLNEQLQKAYKEMRYGQEIAVSGRKQAARIQETIEKTQPIEKYGMEQSTKTIARAAIYAYEREKAQKLEKPLFVAPENIFPEGGYGAHPDELKELVFKSRDAMVVMLKDRGFKEKEAMDVAKDHIKATFDVGHAYTWKKFFERKSGESAEAADNRFKKWMVDKVEELQKEGVIGHVHISDNFGYYDEHVTPGEGGAPIKEAIARLKKAGYKGPVIAEIGGQPEGQMYKAMTGAWRTLHSPMYKIDSHSVGWTDIESSYFGRTGSPTYLVGDVAPSKDWSFWSETPLE